MKRAWALTLAVLMLLTASCSAVAAPYAESAVTIGVYGPMIIKNREETVDLDKIGLQLTGVLDENGIMGMMADVVGGPDYADTLFSGQVQWDDNGIVFRMDGLDKLYNVDIPSVLKNEQSERVVWRFQGMNISSQADLMSLAESILKPYIKDTNIINGNKVYSFDISREDSTLIIESIVGLLDRVVPQLGSSSILTLFGKDDGLGLSLSGKASFGTAGLNMDVTGELVMLKNGEIIPLFQTVNSDDGGFTMTIALGEDKNGIVELSGRQKTNGGWHASLLYTVNNETVFSGIADQEINPETSAKETTLEYVTSAGESVKAEVKNGLSSTSPVLEASYKKMLSDGSEAKDYSLEYRGMRIQTADQTAHGGPLSIHCFDGVDTYEVRAQVAVAASGELAKDWALDARDAEKLSQATDEEVYNLQFNVVGIIDGLLTKVESYVPNAREKLAGIFEFLK